MQIVLSYCEAYRRSCGTCGVAGYGARLLGPNLQVSVDIPEIFWPTPTEVINRTAHAAALSALVETENAYRFYFGVYVRSVSRFTPIYMALIDPFRKLIVYPSLLRGIRAK